MDTRRRARVSGAVGRPKICRVYRHFAPDVTVLRAPGKAAITGQQDDSVETTKATETAGARGQPAAR